MATKFTIEEKISETLKDFKALVGRYTEVKDNDGLLKLFLSRNRNPLFDISNNKMFKTGLKSKNLISSGGKPVEDHFIQRTKAMRLIFNKLECNPNMELEEFIQLLIAIASTASITREEHIKVTTYAKEHNILNYQAYKTLDIEIEGLEKFISENHILI